MYIIIFNKILDHIPDSSSKEQSVFKIPSQVKGMSNDFEIAMWLSHKPDVLDLALKIRAAKQSNLALSTASTSSSLTLASTSAPTLTTAQETLFIMMEETKVLFLRTRDNTKALYEELVAKVLGVPKSDVRIPSYVKKIANWYNDYRYQLKAWLEDKANEWRKLYR